MSNYKVRVNNEAESREVQELFEQLGLVNKDWSDIYFPKLISNHVTGEYSDYPMTDCIINQYKELTTQQLKDLVVLKRNSIDDATHEDHQRNVWFVSGNDKYMMQDSVWELRGDAPLLLKPLTYLKEYLVPQDNGKYALTKATEKRVSDWVEVPEGAEAATFCKNEGVNYWKENGLKWFSRVNKEWCIYSDMEEHIKNHDHKIVWTRHTQPEELPFVDDEPKSLNDTYAEIEQVRQDNVNNPSHYSDSSIECIDAMEAMMTTEQFIGYLRGNVFKYQWRYEKKNGIEDLKKAQWYLDKLVAKVNEK